ncbi:MAG: hypothetical protein EZS28_054958, partial [Streblomastix strix]
QQEVLEQEQLLQQHITTLMSHMNQSVISPILSTPLPQFGPFSPNVTRSPQSPFTPIPPPSIAYILAQQRAQQQARNRQQGIPHHSTPPTTPPSPSSSVASFGSPPPAPLIPPRNGRQNQYQTVTIINPPSAQQIQYKPAFPTSAVSWTHGQLLHN